MSVGKNFGRIIPCLIQKTVAMIVPLDGTLLNFFLLCYVVWHIIPSTAAWIQVQNGRPKSCTPWHWRTGSHHLLYHVIAFLASMCASIGMCHNSEYPISWIISIVFLCQWIGVEHNSSANDIRHHWLVFLLVFTSGITCQKTWICNASTNLSFTVSDEVFYCQSCNTWKHVAWQRSFFLYHLSIKFNQANYSLSLSSSWVTLLILLCPVDGFPGKDVDHPWRDELQKFVTFLKYPVFRFSSFLSAVNK
jgi:hypothetical protein